MITSRDIPEIPLWINEESGNSDSNFYSLLSVFAGQRAAKVANAYSIQAGVITGANSDIITVPGEPRAYLLFYSGVIEQVATFNDFFLYSTETWGIGLSYRGDDGEPLTDEIEVNFGGGWALTDNGNGTWDIQLSIPVSDTNNNLYYLIFYR